MLNYYIANCYDTLTNSYYQTNILLSMRKFLLTSLWVALLVFTTNVKGAPLKERISAPLVFYSYLLKPIESHFYWENFAFFDEVPRYSEQLPLDVPFTEDFESGGLDWTIVNGTQVNKWYVDTVVYAGTSGQSAYISNDGGMTNDYTRTSTSTTHIYRDIFFPDDGAEEYVLSFDWMAWGEGITTKYDYLRVNLVDPSVSPTAGTLLSTGTIVNLNQDSIWSTETFILSDSVKGETKRLVFTWRNDGGDGNQPPVAIDNITIIANNCAKPNGYQHRLYR